MVATILLMEEILHQLIGSLSQYLQGVTHPRLQDFFHEPYVCFGMRRFQSPWLLYWPPNLRYHLMSVFVGTKL